MPDPEKPVPSAEDRHHLARVLRLKAGELVVAADGRGSFSLCRFSGDSGSPGTPSTQVLVPVSPLYYEEPAGAPVTVAFVPAKGERAEWVVQKLTELGVDRIVVLASARAVVRWPPERVPGALARLGRVARGASSQSRRAWLPEIRGVMGIEDYAAEQVVAGGGGCVMAHPGAAPPGGALGSIAVGPEGGWDPAELERATELVGLGRTVMRAETAALAAGYALCARRDGFL